VALAAWRLGQWDEVRSCVHSSSTLAGTFEPDYLDRRDEDGVSYREALVAFGGDPAGVPALARRRQDVLGYLEIHIEQGPVLEAEGLPVGIVTAINGASRRRVVVTGEGLELPVVEQHGSAGLADVDLDRLLNADHYQVPLRISHRRPLVCVHSRHRHHDCRHAPAHVAWLQGLLCSNRRPERHDE
jgi:hypothetical protein